MVQRHTSDAGRARMLAELFYDALAREWLDGSLLQAGTSGWRL